VITFLPDRYSKADLLQNYPEVAKSLADRWSVMMENSHETVAWVGIARAHSVNSTVFLPHGAPSDEGERETFAVGLMEAIVRFAKESSRDGDSRDLEGATQAALLSELAADYRDNGLFATREKIRTRNNGKPDWARTLKKEAAFPASNGAAVYCEISTTRFSSFATNLIARIQAHIIQEIAHAHGWWLGQYFGAREIPRGAFAGEWPRRTWLNLLRSVRHNLFQTRAIRLVQMLIDYLEATAETGVGNIICGISDFSMMWETMLRETLDHVENGWNERLPGPRYIRHDGTYDEAGRMRLDVVVRHESQTTILDAKYYRATTSSLAPDLSDIMKQLIYQRAYETCLTDSAAIIKSAFVFPAPLAHAKQFDRIEFVSRAGLRSEVFPPIYCHYVSTSEVVLAYSTRAKLKDQSWVASIRVPLSSPVETQFSSERTIT
jgi:hypothetical protein